MTVHTSETKVWGDLSEGFDSLSSTLDFYEEQGAASCFPEPLVSLSQDEPLTSIALAGSQHFGEVTFLGQAHVPPLVRDSDYLNLYIGAAQARIYTELDKGQFSVVFCEGKYYHLETQSQDNSKSEVIRREFERLFPDGAIASTLNKEQLLFFYDNQASDVYAALNSEVKIIGAEDVYALNLALAVAFREDVPLEQKDLCILNARDAFIVQNLCDFFKNPGFRGQHVALVLGAMHKLEMTSQLKILSELHSISDLPLIIKKTFSHDVNRCLFLSPESWSQDLLHGSEYHSSQQYAQVAMRPMLTWVAFEALETTEAQLSGLPRLEVNKACFPTADSLYSWLLENRLIPALVSGKLVHINPSDREKLFFKVDKFSSAEEVEASFRKRDRGPADDMGRIQSSGRRLRELIDECFTRFEHGGIPLGDPMLSLISDLYKRQAGPFTVYRNVTSESED